MDRALHLEIEAAQRLKDKLATVYGDDEELIRDMVQGETNLHEAMAKVAEELAAVESEAEGIELALARLKERHKRHTKKAEGLREALQVALETAELKSLKTPCATLSMRASPQRVEITDAAQVPPVFMIQPPPYPDKNAIKDALKAGATVAGCVLSNQPPSLAVKFT